MSPLSQVKAIAEYLKDTFIGKDEIIDLLTISLIARENAFLLGPPGTAKSAIVRGLSECIENGKNFEYLLTRFTEPNELFGPFDIRKLKEGELVTNTEGMLPEASLVFLDEIFNANSAILNSLLMALNEHIFRRGRENRKIPALMFTGASNVLPEDDALQALLDRFLIRIKCDYVDPDHLQEVLVAGWKLENATQSEKPTISVDAIRTLQQQAKTINLSEIRQRFVDVIHTLRNTGIKVSDRRAVKLQNLIAASAVMCGRDHAILSDLWVLKYIWDTEEQIEILEGIINNLLEKESAKDAHPQAMHNRTPDPEELMREVKHLISRWTENLTAEEQNVIKDKLRYVQARGQWIGDDQQKSYIQQEIDGLWKKILHTA